MMEDYEVPSLNGEIGRPIVHEPTPTLEQVRPCMRRLHLVGDDVRQRRLDDVSLASLISAIS